VRGASLPAIKPMTRFDDELEYVCAWGRWRIDQARNDSVLPAERRHAPPPRERVVHGARKPLRRGRARLRLVAGAGRPAKAGGSQ
jgi:hypothetical protein